MLLDLNDPSKVLGRCRCNILEPREIWEVAGQVPNVTFPSGMIVEEYDAEGFALERSEVKIYYGAADTSVGLLITSIYELLDAAMEGDIPS
jgi:beta-1,4-mannooligosaccharide/beta-1,4-mannosyl-N-acetylglucosamine phosphorylase